MANWEQGGKGAVGGAMTGAALGSVVPGVGTAVGAAAGGLLGGLGGLFSGDPTEDYRRQLAAYAGGPAPQIDNTNLARYSGFRDNQGELIRMLEAQSRGEGPSLAAAQLAAATDRNVKQSQSMAAGARGPNAALAQMQAQQAQSAMGAQAAQDAAQARIQEIYNARQQLGLNIHGARQADEGINTFNAGARNARDMANLQARLESRGMGINAMTAAGGMAGQPGFGDQMLAGGAGSLAGMLTQQAQAKASAPKQAGGFSGMSYSDFAGMFGNSNRKGAPGGGGQQAATPYLGTDPWNRPGI